MPDRQGPPLDPEEILRRLQEAMASSRRRDDAEEGEDVEGEEVDPEVLEQLQALESQAQELLADLEGEGWDDEDQDDEDDEDDVDVASALSSLMGMADGLSGLMEKLGFEMPDVEAILKAEAEDPYGDPDWGLAAYLTLESGMEIQAMAEFDLLRTISDSHLRAAEADEETREEMREIAADAIGGELGQLLNKMQPGEDAARLLDVQVARHAGDRARPMVVPPEVRIPLDVRSDMLLLDLRPLVRAASPSAPVDGLEPAVVPIDSFEEGEAFSLEPAVGPGAGVRRVALAFTLLD
jgi:hypothetical protein